MEIFEIKKVANGNNGLFYNDKFCGLISDNGLRQFSGNLGEIFDADLCATFLLQKHKEVFSKISSVGNQLHLIMTTKPYNLEEGVWTKHTI